ncbi:hypothetical protein [Streptomyces sp. NPDC050538]
MANLASVTFRPKHELVLVHLRIDPDTVELEEDLEKASPLIRRAFETA